MPNHTSQVLTINCDKETFNKIKKDVKGEEQAFDQDAFFPMPKELVVTSSPAIVLTDENYEKYFKGEEVPTVVDGYGHTRMIKLPEKPCPFGDSKPISESIEKALLEKWEVNNWYDWANNYWGTKWGVYDCGEWNDKEQSIFFMSAWSPATLIIQKLSEKFPEAEFVLESAEEGGGFLLCETIQNGETTYTELDWDSDDGIAVREKLGCYYPEDEEQAAEDEEAQQLKDEKNGLYPDKIDIAN